MNKRLMNTSLYDAYFLHDLGDKAETHLMKGLSTIEHELAVPGLEAINCYREATQKIVLLQKQIIDHKVIVQTKHGNNQDNAFRNGRNQNPIKVDKKLECCGNAFASKSRLRIHPGKKCTKEVTLHHCK